MVCNPVHDSVHVGILTPNGYNHSGSPRAVLGLHPGRIGQDIPVGKKFGDGSDVPQPVYQGSRQLLDDRF